MPGQRFGPAWFPGSIAAGLGICGLFLIFAGVRQGAFRAEHLYPAG